MITKPKVHTWAHPYGDVHDPWPGDLAAPTGWWWYRFDGQVWHFAGVTGVRA